MLFLSVSKPVHEYFLNIILDLPLGVILGAILAWFFNRNLKRMELIKNLQLRASEELQGRILMLYNTKANISYPSLVSSVKSYISMLSRNTNFNTWIIDSFSNANKDWIEYCHPVSSFLYTFEIREIVLAEF